MPAKSSVNVPACIIRVFFHKVNGYIASGCPIDVCDGSTDRDTPCRPRPDWFAESRAVVQVESGGKVSENYTIRVGQLLRFFDFLIRLNESQGTRLAMVQPADWKRLEVRLVST